MHASAIGCISTDRSIGCGLSSIGCGTLPDACALMSSAAHSFVARCLSYVVRLCAPLPDAAFGVDHRPFGRYGVVGACAALRVGRRDPLQPSPHGMYLFSEFRFRPTAQCAAAAFTRRAAQARFFQAAESGDICTISHVRCSPSNQSNHVSALSTNVSTPSTHL
jgi:hypothetical protein